MPAVGTATAWPIANSPAEGTWQDRFVHWLRDLGFFQKPGVETLAAQDVAEFVKPPAAKP